MESNRSNKRKGFAKSKLLMSIYRGGKPKPDSLFVVAPPPPPSTTAAMGFIIVKQDHQVYPPQKPKVAFVVPDRNGGCAKLESFYGGAAEDEGVDAKAARYISTVQERFRLECVVNSERKNIHEMQLIS